MTLELDRGFHVHLEPHPGFQLLTISLHQPLLAITRGVQIAPFVIMQSNGQTWFLHPPLVSEKAARSLYQVTRDSAMTAKVMAGQELSQAGMSPGKETIHKVRVSHEARAWWSTRFGSSHCISLSSPALAARPCVVSVAHLRRQQTCQSEAPSAHPW